MDEGKREAEEPIWEQIRCENEEQDRRPRVDGIRAFLSADTLESRHRRAEEERGNDGVRKGRVGYDISSNSK